MWIVLKPILKTLLFNKWVLGALGILAIAAFLYGAGIRATNLKWKDAIQRANQQATETRSNVEAKSDRLGDSDVRERLRNDTVPD